MNLHGIIIGVVAFIIIGVFHPIVVKCEYHFTYRIWPVFLVLGLISLIISFLIKNTIASSALGVLGCTLLWSIRELKEQEERVAKGWFPRNPSKNKEDKNEQ